MERPDVVLCDLGLPGGMTGYDLRNSSGTVIATVDFSADYAGSIQYRSPFRNLYFHVHWHKSNLWHQSKFLIFLFQPPRPLAISSCTPDETT